MAVCEPEFFARLTQDVRVLENVCFILNKTNRDGYLRRLQETVAELLAHELRFAMRELLALETRISAAEVRRQLVNNTLIFKENLKAILGHVGGVSSGRGVEGTGQGGGAGGGGEGGQERSAAGQGDSGDKGRGG